MNDDENKAAIPTPAEMAEALRGLPEDTALDILNSVAKTTGGWTPLLDEVGLRLLKPDAPEGQEKGA